MPTADGIKFEVRRNCHQLTRDRLIQHFRGDDPEDRIAVYTVSPDDETCKVTVVDIDAHGPEDDPDANWAFALAVARRAMARGVEVLVFASNGAGGYHVLCFHSQPIPCAEAYRFARWLVHDWAQHGLRRQPEWLPKGAGLTGKRFGQPIRLPGQHPKRKYWTAVWDGATEAKDSGFLRGAAAIAAILRTGGRRDRPLAGPLVPPDFVPPGGRSTAAIPRRQVDPDDLDRDAALARDALRFLDESYYDDYDRWVQVGMALRQLGDVGLDWWHEWSSQSSLYRSSELDEKWQTFESATESLLAQFGRRSHLIGLGSLFAWAKENGWKRPETRTESTRRGPRRTWSFSVKL
jgi:hypothetical protein